MKLSKKVKVKRLIKKAITIVVLLFLLLNLSVAIYGLDDFYDDTSKQYFIGNAERETSAKNIVTGIYLEYRLLDTIFETAVLMVSATGIIYMTKRDDKVI